MGARYLKVEETIIRARYPTAPRAEILEAIPGRTWAQIGVHARRMRILRTTKARGNSIADGRKALKHAWSDMDNKRFDAMYPTVTRAQLSAAFPSRTWESLQSHAQKRQLHRTRQAVGMQVNIGRNNLKEEKAALE